VKAPYAESSFRAVAGALDKYTSELTQATVENCRATRLRGEQSEATQTLRQACLDARLEQVRALAQLLESPSSAALDKADAAVQALEPVRSCADVRILTDAAPTDPIALRDYNAQELKLALARAQLAAGLLIPSLGTAQGVLTKAHELGVDGLAADAQLVRGTALLAAGSFDQALAALKESTWTGLAAHRDDVVTRSALVAAGVLVDQESKPDAAQVWIDLSTATSARSEFFRELLRTERLEVQGAIQASRGELEAAIKTHEAAIVAAQQAFGADSASLWQPEEMLATTLGRAGAWIAAIPHLEHALALREQTVGPDHPDVALLLSNLGACYDHAGDPKRAHGAYERALAIRERTYGASSPFLVATLNNLADFKRKSGDLDGAMADVARAKAIAVRVPGTASPLYHVVATTEAEVLSSMGKVAEARAAFDAAIELEQTTQSPVLATTLASRADLELGQRAYADAIALEERSITGFETMGGKDSLDLWRPLAGLATAKRAIDPHADVRLILTRAVAIATKAQIRDADVAPLREALAHTP
jgi:eukaryotic-like serine/threonine-protein kinase